MAIASPGLTVVGAYLGGGSPQRSAQHASTIPVSHLRQTLSTDEALGLFLKLSWTRRSIPVAWEPTLTSLVAQQRHVSEALLRNLILLLPDIDVIFSSFTDCKMDSLHLLASLGARVMPRVSESVCPIPSHPNPYPTQTRSVLFPALSPSPALMSDPPAPSQIARCSDGGSL